MFSSTKTIFLVVILSSLFALSCKGAASGKDGEAVAKVGTNEIKMKQVDRAIKQRMNLSSATSASFSPAELSNARLSVLDQLIQNEALYQRAQKEQGLVPDDAKVMQEIQKQKQDQGLSEEQYKESLKQNDFSEDEVREEIRKGLAINALLEREKTRVKEPKEEEIKKYYEDHKAEFVAERGVDIAVIAVSPSNNGGDAGAEQKIKTVYAQLRGGSDFATVASQKSEEQNSALRGGRLGFASEQGLRQSFPTMPGIFARLMSMTEGQYTEPIKDTTGNWYIFKLNLKREQPQNLTLDDVRKDIIDAITQQRQQVLLNALVMLALAEAGVKNYLAERIVQNPQMIVEMQPSQLLQQASQPQSSQPRIENQNQPAPNSNRPASMGTPANSNNRPATANANR